jgi:hypothetical protein
MKKNLIIIAYVIFIGYKRISMIGIAFMPIGLWLMSAGISPTGRRTDEKIFNNPLLYLLGGVVWLFAYIIFALWLQVVLAKKLNLIVEENKNK